MEYIIEHGNIVYYDTDAIVLPANRKLLEGPGTSKDIFSAAGRHQLTEACRELGGCKVGMAVATPGYKLSADYIIHAVVPRWKDGNHGEYDYLSSAYLSALTLADVMKCKSIAFPLLSAGNNGFRKDIALEVACKSIESFSGENLETVKLVILKEEVVVFIKSLGYDVVESEGYLQYKERKIEQNNRNKQAMKKGMKIAGDIAGVAIKIGIDYLMNENVQKTILKTGAQIVKGVLLKGKSKE